MKVKLISCTTFVVLFTGITIGAIFGVFNGVLAVILSILVVSLLRARFGKSKVAEPIEAPAELAPAI